MPETSELLEIAELKLRSYRQEAARTDIWTLQPRPSSRASATPSHCLAPGISRKQGWVQVLIETSRHVVTTKGSTTTNDDVYLEKLCYL